MAASGASLAFSSITTDAGDATSDPNNGSGEGGGPVTLKASGNVGVGAISTHGGSGRALGGGGPGGAVSVTGDRVTTGSVTALGENLSAAGGSVVLSAQSSLLVGGVIDTSGAAGSTGNPGGAGGSMLLSAAHGPLTLGGRLRSEGGAGGNGPAVGATAATAARSSWSRSPSAPRPASSAAAATAAPRASRTDRAVMAATAAWFASGHRRRR